MEKIVLVDDKPATWEPPLNAPGSEAAPVHYEHVERFEVQAAPLEARGIDLADSLPPPIYAVASSRQESPDA